MKLAFVFPGQGSQSLGMMQAYGESPVIRQTFEEASSALGDDLWRLASEGPAESLNLTTNTQPLMLTAGVAVYRAWLEQGGVEPQIVAGHSLGEYSALVAAGALNFADAVPLVRFRAQAMQEAVPTGQGAMAALLGLDEDTARSVCGESAQGEVVEVANLNSIGQIVIAGQASAVTRAAELAKQRGAKRAVLLPVSAPFHCSLMRPAAERLAQKLAEVAISEPTIAVLNNVDVACYSAPAQIRDALVRQAFSPVRWIETIQAMAAQGVTHLYECGPGKVLAGMTKRLAGNVQGGAIADASSLQATIQTIRGE